MDVDQLILFVFVCCLSSRFAGHGKRPQSPAVPPHRAARVAAELEMDRQRDHLGHDWRGGDGAGRLPPDPRRHPPALLREATGHRGPAAQHPIQQPGRQLLPGRRAVVAHVEQPDVHRGVPDGGRRLQARHVPRRRVGPRAAVTLRRWRARVLLQQRHQGERDQVTDRQAPARPGSADMADHLHVLAVHGGRVADVLRLPLVVLQQHDRAVSALQLRLPTTTTAPQCISEGEKPELPAGDGEAVAPVFLCTDHMCPVRVHWHVKISYREYWRVKVTITNYNQVKNYSDWNLVVQHPNLRSLTQLFSFNYQPLIEYGTLNDTGMFWGIQYYNEMLLQDGNVQTEMILKKDKSDFTFSGGWAFPRRVYFDGHECVMPPPDQYPCCPTEARTRASRRRSGC